MSERLDRIEASIERLSNALDVLVQQLITPAVRQSSANHERLDQVDELLIRTAEQSATNADAIAQLTVRAAETDTRFNVLVSELRADRRASQQAFQALLLQLAGINGRVEDLERAS